MSQALTKPFFRRTVHGALGGALAAACMTVVRMVAHRAGLIRQMVPQAVEVWAYHHAPLSHRSSQSHSALHHVADQAIHLGYGATLGAVYGALSGRNHINPTKILGYGVANWVFGSCLLLPSLGVLRPVWRARVPEIAVDLSAHLLYAAALGLVMDEMEAQTLTQPRQYPLSLVAKTG
jgi:hypothetical protein